MLEEHYGLALPRDLLVEFSSHVQKLTETLDREVKIDEIYQCLLTPMWLIQSPIA